MAASRETRRVAAQQRGFLPFTEHPEVSAKRKRINKNKKKSWKKHSRVQDVEEFLEDVRLQERTVGGLIADKPDHGLFFVDTGERPAAEQGQKKSRPLWEDLILQPSSHIPAPKDILAHQQPNAKKLKRAAQKAERLAAKGVLPRQHKQLLKQNASKTQRQRVVPNNHPNRAYYDLWGQEERPVADEWFLEQTKKKPVKRPDRLNEKPSALPAVEVIAPGGSYMPEFFSHQALLQEAHDEEVKKQKEDLRVQHQLAVNKDDFATEETMLQEQVEGLLEEEEEQEEEHQSTVSATTQQKKKTEKQRKREKAEKLKERQRRAQRELVGQKQQVFQLRTIRAELHRRNLQSQRRRAQRLARKEAQKLQPRRLGKLRYRTPELDVQLSAEIPDSLRTLKPEGSILKDRFKSLQKRNLIEPRERAKFKRKYKLKYTEKRAFKAIT